MTKLYAPILGLITVEIDFGRGSRAYSRWMKLDALMTRVRRALRDNQQASQARILYDWQQGVGYRVDKCPESWIMECDGEQWQALSCGLRHLGTEGSSMYQWLVHHRLCTFEGDRT